MQPEIILNSEDIRKSLEGKSGPFGEKVHSNIDESVIVSRTVTAENISPVSEMHEKYNDLFFVLEGQEELFIGGQILGKEENGPGEWKGSGLESARRYTIKKGDIIIIPKKIPHQHGEGSVKMIVVKTS